MVNGLKKFITLNILAASAVLISSCGNNDDNKITNIVFTSDMQGNVDLIGKAGALRDSFDEDAATYLIDCGNSVSGSVKAATSNGTAVTDIMETAGYDCVVLSAKDIDCTGDLLLTDDIELIPTINNLQITTRPDIQNSRIAKIDEVKSGFLGISDLIENDIYSTISGDELYNKLNTCTTQYKTEKCDLVILSITDGEKELCEEIASKVNDIDIIISTGAESNTTEESNGVFIVYKAANNTDAGVITCSNGEYEVEYKALDEYQSSTEIQSLIDESDNNSEEQSFDCNQELEGDSVKNETPFGDLVAEAVKKASGADGALIDGSLFNAGLKTGTLTYEDLISSVNDSQIVKVQFKGEELLNIVQDHVENSTGILQSCGIVYTIDTTSKETRIVSVNNELFDSDEEYVIAICIPDYDYSKNVSVGVSATLHTSLYKYVSDTLEGVIDNSYAVTKGMITYTDITDTQAGPDCIGLYRHDKETHIRYLLNDFTGVFTTGENVGSFEAIAGLAESYTWSNYKAEYRSLFYGYPDSEQSKIGYKIKFTLEDGSEYNYVITEPDDTEAFFDYIEVYIYDDINQPDGVRYSHLTKDQMTDQTLMTSVKLHGGLKIGEVQEIWLTTFIYNGDKDFNPDSGDYIGDVSYMTYIHR